MNSELQDIIDEGFEKEIEATINYELAGEYTAAEIEMYIKHFREDKGFIPEKIKKYQLLPVMTWDGTSVPLVEYTTPYQVTHS